MKYRVRLTDKAEGDVETVLRWFHEQRATAAGERWFSRLMANIDTLETHPERCALAAEAEDIGLEIREQLFGRRLGVYRILFLIEKRTVHILRVWHAARDRVSPGGLVNDGAGQASRTQCRNRDRRRLRRFEAASDGNP